MNSDRQAISKPDIPALTGNRRYAAILIMLGAISLLTLLACPFFGYHEVNWQELWGGKSMGGRIFWQLRVPRVLLGYVAGASLALSGMSFQALFRNPLATPYTLGVSSGAALGVALYVYSGLALTGGILSGAGIASFFGAGLAIALVYGLSRLRGNASVQVMLLAGVAVSFFFSSLIMFVQYVSDFTELRRVTRWMMGGLETAGYLEVVQLGTVCGLAIVILLSQLSALNLIAVGDEFALSRGVPVLRVRRILFFAVSLLVGGVVAFCGPIGFVGMISPHICRLLVGANVRRLAPVTMLFGGAFLVCCDTLGRTLAAPVEVPTGVITALLGGPFFLWLLFRRA